MPDTQNIFANSKGLIADRPSVLQNKIADFAKTGPASMYAVFDFDRTLTVRRPGTQEEVTTWHILREHLPPPGLYAYQRLFETYRAIERCGNMTARHAAEWWTGSLELFAKYGVDLTAVERTFLERASIRPGTAELFGLLAANCIPTVILSAGIRDVIDMWCRKYGVQPSLIVSTALTFDKDNKITGWQKDTLVHALSKSEVVHSELSAIRARRPKALLVGDSLDDADMAAGECNVIRVRVFDPRQDEQVSEQDRRKTFEKFDALLSTSSLRPLCRVVQSILSPAA